ncbi:MAG: glycosyltransferase family 39 protein [Betaproteobacteria bacterium]|nr:glycosyltransferase family 39 protein [Betaproteobacteria bacterium]
MRTLLSSEKNLNFDGKATPLKTALFLLVCLAWLIPGLTGHTPWKYDEAVSQGIVHSLVHGHGHWLSPDLAGETYLAHPPLYYWVAAGLVRLLHPLLPPHDAARLASGLFMALTMIGIALAAHGLFGARAMRLSVLVLIGSVGLVIRAHEMSADLAWLCGVIWTLAGIPTGRTRPLLGGLLGGLGFGMAFLSQGTLAFGLLLPIVLLTPLLVPAYRPARPLYHFLLWILAALPALLVWPLLLKTWEPGQFTLWWPVLTRSILHPQLWIAPDAIPTYYLGAMTWFAWPATPLALGTLWTGRLKGLAQPPVRFLLLTLAVMLLVLGFCTTPRESNALPLLLPLSLLAAGGLDSLRRGASSALDWFGMLTFGLVTAVLWLGWVALITGQPAPVVKFLETQLPGYHAKFHPAVFALSLALTLLWIVTILRSRPSPRRALVNWTVGMTVSWMLVMSLWLPYVEASRSYEGMMRSLARAIPPHSGCMASSGLGEPQRGLLYYYLDIRTQRLELGTRTHCGLWLVQSNPRDHFLVPSGWRLIWSGSRSGDHTERFQLFEY